MKLGCPYRRAVVQRAQTWRVIHDTVPAGSLTLGARSVIFGKPRRILSCVRDSLAHTNPATSREPPKSSPQQGVCAQPCVRRLDPLRFWHWPHTARTCSLVTPTHAHRLGVSELTGAPGPAIRSPRIPLSMTPQARLERVDALQHDQIVQPTTDEAGHISIPHIPIAYIWPLVQDHRL